MPKGKVPSLLSANNGGIVYDIVQRRSECGRCKYTLTAGAKIGLLKVQTAGFTNKKRLCPGCISDIIDKTQLELDIIRNGLDG